MAQKVIFVDDISGEEAEGTQTRYYSIGEKSYKVDLSEEHWDEFLEAFYESMKKFTDVSELLPPVKYSKKRMSSVPVNNVHHLDNQAVRDWARENNVPLKARGKIPDEVKEKYLESLGDSVS